MWAFVETYYWSTVTSDDVRETIKHVKWREERVWNISILQKVHISSIILFIYLFNDALNGLYYVASNNVNINELDGIMREAVEITKWVNYVVRSCVFMSRQRNAGQNHSLIKQEPTNPLKMRISSNIREQQ